MGIKKVPFFDFSAVLDKLQAIADNVHPSATDVAVDPTGMEIITANNSQGALKQLDTAVDSVNSSLAQLENNGSSGAISLDSYNTSSNKYTIPYDGYVQLSGGSATSGYIRVFIETSNGVGLQQYMVVTNSWTYQTVFVKKGFKVYVAGNTVSGGSVSYVPLDS